MKKLILIALIACAGRASAQQDTLQAKIGESSEMLIIMKNAAAREEIRKLDLNKIAEEMLHGLETSATRVATMKAFSHEDYRKPRKTVFSKTYLNYFLGFSYADNYLNPESAFLSSAYQGISNSSSTGSITTQSYSNSILASPYIAVSANKDMELLRKQKVGVALKMGAEPFFNYEKLTFAQSNLEAQFPSGIYRSTNKDMSSSSLLGPQNIDPLLTAEFDEENNLMRYSLYGDRNSVQSFVSYPYNVIKAGVNLRLLPKISFFNARGKRLFSLAAGPTAGLNIIRKSVTKISSENTVTDPVLISGTRPAAYRYGLAAELGIGGISFFGQFITSGTENKGQLAQLAAENNINVTSKDQNYRTHSVNFGLRFGK